MRKRLLTKAQQPLSRRRFLGGAAAAALVACGDRRAFPVPARGSTVSFSNRPFAMDGALLAEFEDRYGVRVDYHEDIRGNGDGDAIPFERDLVILGGAVAARLSQSDGLERVDPNDLSHRRELRQPPTNDIDMLPWSATWLVLARRTSELADEVPLDDLLTGDDVAVALPADPQVTVGAILLGVGLDPDTATTANLGLALERLRAAQARGVARIGGRPIDALRRGEVPVALVTAMEAAGLPGVATGLPAERTMVVEDRAVIPRGPANREAAIALLNFFYDPAVSARLFAAVPAASPVDGVRERFGEGPRNPPAAVRESWSAPPTIAAEVATAFAAMAPQ